MKILIALLLLATPVLAEEDSSCAVECDEGQNKVTFADGNNTRCVCVDPGRAMEDGPAGCEGSECEDPHEQTGE